jgi:hypothetical protein
LDEVVEGRTRCHILKELVAGRLDEPCGVRDYLGDLASGGVTVRAKIRKVTRWHTWLAQTPTRIAGHMASVG